MRGSDDGIFLNEHLSTSGGFPSENPKLHGAKLLVGAVLVFLLIAARAAEGVLFFRFFWLPGGDFPKLWRVPNTLVLAS